MIYGVILSIIMEVTSFNLDCKFMKRRPLDLAKYELSQTPKVLTNTD